VTLGSLLIIFAAIDLIASFLLGMAVARGQEELAPEKRTPAPYIIIGAGFVSAAILCILAFYWSEANRLIV